MGSQKRSARRIQRALQGMVIGGLLAAVMCLPRCASAQKATDKYKQDSGEIRKNMQATASRSANQIGEYGTDTVVSNMLSLPSLPGSLNWTDTANEEEAAKFRDGKATEYGPRQYVQRSTVLPPLLGFRAMNDSKVMQSMFKELITTEVPLYFQSMYTLENGAATGYANALNAVSNVMANTFQSQSFMMQISALDDPFGKSGRMYANRLAKEIKERKNWPAAVFATVGDMPSKEYGGDGGEAGKFSQYKLDNKQPWGIADLQEETGQSATESPSNSPNGGSSDGDCPDDDNKNATKGKTVRRLSRDLFGDDKAASSGDKKATWENNDLPKLKKEFLDRVGDICWVEEPLNGNASSGTDAILGRNIAMRYKIPTQDKGHRGFEREQREELELVWESWNMLLQSYCNFKKNNPNEKKEIFKKDAVSTSKDFLTDDVKEAWKYASAPDIAITINLLDQAYQMISKQRHEKVVKCDDLAMKLDQIPVELDKGGSEQKFDQCKQKEGCMRNRLYLYMATILARSRALHYYRDLLYNAQRFATVGDSERWLHALFIKHIGDFDFDAQISINRTRWVDFIQFLGKYNQGQQGAGAFFRGGQGVAGFDPSRPQSGGASGSN